MMISFDMNNPLAHANGPLVVKLGGAAVDDPAAGSALWDAIAALHQSEKKGLVLVHGGGAAIDRRLAALGMKSERKEGIRITPDEHIGEVVATLNGVINPGVVAELQTRGVPAVGLTLADGMTTRAMHANSYAFDPGCVGEVLCGDEKLLRTLLAARFLPVVCSIALDEGGQPLNINADDAAASLAAIVRASSLVLLTDTPGILDADGRLIEQAGAADIERMIASGAISGGMIPKARGAVRTAENLRAPVIIASWRSAERLPLAARGLGPGTRILPPESSP